jgi:hypothetical protein
VQSPALHGTAHRLLTVTGMTGIAYTLSWIAGVSIPRPARRSPPPGRKLLPPWPGTGRRWPRNSLSPRACLPRAWP